MIKLIQIYKRQNRYYLKDIYINPSYIVYMSESYEEKRNLVEGAINLQIDKNASFTKIKINENSNISEIVVLGEPELIELKLFKISGKTLLRG